jgi:exonuclease VII small subunit
MVSCRNCFHPDTADNWFMLTGMRATRLARAQHPADFATAHCIEPERNQNRMLTMTDTTVCDVEHLSFEKALEELESIVKHLEDNGPANETRAVRARSEALRRHCMAMLADIPGC